MNEDKNRKRTEDLRWIGIQSFLAGIVLVSVTGLFCFIFFNKDPNSQPNGYLAGKGLGLLLVCGIWGLCLIVRGIIYLIRALSGNEQYAKNVESVMDKFESRHKAMMGKKVANGSMHNVLVLLGWVFLILAIVAAIAIGYTFWTTRGHPLTPMGLVPQ